MHTHPTWARPVSAAARSKKILLAPWLTQARQLHSHRPVLDIGNPHDGLSRQSRPAGSADADNAGSAATAGQVRRAHHCHGNAGRSGGDAGGHPERQESATTDRLDVGRRRVRRVLGHRWNIGTGPRPLKNSSARSAHRHQPLNNFDTSPASSGRVQMETSSMLPRKLGSFFHADRPMKFCTRSMLGAG